MPDFSGPSTVSLMKFSDGWEIIQMDVKIVWIVMDNGIFNGLRWDYTGIVGDKMGMPSGNQT